MANARKYGDRGVRTSAHSIRTTEELWSSAKHRAQSEGVTMNYVVEQILEGYSRGLVDLPRIEKQWASGPTKASA